MERSTRNAEWILVVVAAWCVAASPPDATAEVTEIPLAFIIDEEKSELVVSGSVLGIGLRGDRTAAFGGSIETRIGMEDDVALGFVVDESFLAQLDPFAPTVPNPIPFLPALAEIEIVDLTFTVHIDTTGFSRGGSFSTTNASFEVLSGLISVDGLGFEIDDYDFTGLSADRFPLAGDFELLDEEVRVGFPLELFLEIEDLGDFTFEGLIVAYAPL